MNRNSTLKGKIILIFTNSTFFSSYFTQAFSLAIKHQFIQPALVIERERSQSHPSIDNLIRIPEISDNFPREYLSLTGIYKQFLFFK